jgi:hypothetical protein
MEWAQKGIFCDKTKNFALRVFHRPSVGEREASIFIHSVFLSPQHHAVQYKFLVANAKIHSVNSTCTTCQIELDNFYVYFHFLWSKNDV